MFNRIFRHFFLVSFIFFFFYELLWSKTKPFLSSALFPLKLFTNYICHLIPRLQSNSDNLKNSYFLRQGTFDINYRAEKAFNLSRRHCVAFSENINGINFSLLRFHHVNERNNYFRASM
mgnify:FL=1